MKPHVHKRISRKSDYYSLDEQIGHLLRKAYQCASANTSRLMDEYRITPVQYAALARLWEHGSVSQNRLGRMIDMEAGNFHSLMRRLIERGLVCRQNDTEDRRKVSVELTAAGELLVKKLIPLSIQGTGTTLSGLSENQIRQLYRYLKHIVDTADNSNRAGLSK